MVRASVAGLWGGAARFWSGAAPRWKASWQSCEAYSGINHGVKHVNYQVGERVNDGHEECRSHDGRKVKVDGAVVGILSDPRPGEDPLDEDGTGEDVGQCQSSYRDDWGEGGPQYVAEHHRVRRQPLRPCRVDVVVFEYLKYGGTGEAGN